MILPNGSKYTVNRIERLEHVFGGEVQDGRGLQLTTFDFVTGCQETKLSFRQKVKPFSHFFYILLLFN